MILFTDSGSDLPKKFFDEHDVVLFPLRVHLNNQEYPDIIGVDLKEFYDEMRKGAAPKTSQVSPEDFYNTFEKYAKEGEEGIYISFSSQLSGTYNTAVMIAEQLREKYPDFKLNMIDTKCASLGQGLVVKKAVELRDAGVPFDELAEKVENYANHMQHIFTVENLDYLARGGRISKSSAFFGGLMSIKPILHVEDGKLIPLEKVRGRKKALARMVEMMAERGGDFSNKIVGISHGDDLETVEELKKLIEAKLHPKGFDVTMVGAVIGSHSGPGTLAIFFTDQDYKE
ncbi:DegV family protein [Ureibacillus thermophilus]|uniref:DegV family protein n=1 Tax=Ureibacillus thermophilus TaxID=367743 RepID=UPI0036104169